MELRLYAAILNRRKWVILVTAVVTLAVVAVGTSRMTPIYSASAVARVADVRHNGHLQRSELRRQIPRDLRLPSQEPAYS